MKLRIHHYLCLIAALAILFPCNAHAVIWSYKSVISYGAVGDGMTNDTAAINLAIAGDKMVYFPPGTYKYVGPMTLPANASYRIHGDGPGVSTILFFGPNAGIKVTHTAVATLNVEGLTLMAHDTNDGTGIDASFAPSVPGITPKFKTATIHNVQIIGTTRDGTTGGYWTNGIHLSRAHNAVIDKIHISGNKNVTQTGILWDTPSDVTTGLHLSSLEIKWCNTALATNGPVEGVYLTGFEFISCGRSGYAAVSLYTTADSAFHLVNGQVDSVGDGVVMNGMIFAKISNVYFRHNGTSPEITPGTMVSINDVTDAIVSECTFYGVDSGAVSDENGIFLTTTHSVRIAGNNFSHMLPTNGSCIVIMSSSSVIRITDNLFSMVRQQYNDQAMFHDTYYLGNNP